MAGASIKIPAELFALAESSRFEGELDEPMLQIGPDDYTFAAPLRWAVDVTNTGSALLVAGAVTGVGTCACARCLEEVSHSFDGEIEGYFLIEGPETSDFEEDGDVYDGDLEEAEFDVLPDDHIIDMMPLIEAALFVDAPQMPLCREDCKGLCPQCGANLNDGDCGCGPDESLAAFERESNPFAALANFKFE